MIQIKKTSRQAITFGRFMSNNTIGFIGGGNMAQALIGGLLDSGAPAKQIVVSDPSPEVQETLKQMGVRVLEPADLVDEAKSVVLAVKPQLFDKVLPSLGELLSDQLVISIAAGVSTGRISQLLGGYTNLIRCMPNTPALVGEGACGLYAASGVTEEAKQQAQGLFEASGVAIWVDKEEQLHAVTAVSGSAPAYFFMFVEHMVKAATELGLDPADAHKLAVQTALGSARMMSQSDKTPEELRNKVTSAGGTTHAAIQSMQKAGVGELIEQGMKACVDRSIEMANS